MLVAILIRMRVQVAPCDRYRLRVTTWGPYPIGGPYPRGSGASPHAIVLPGISADWRALAPQIWTLRRLGWTVHVVDLPGFALRPALKASDASVMQLADYVARVVTGLTIPPALVLGHSLGGGVAMHLAIRHPELVSGLAHRAGRARRLAALDLQAVLRSAARSGFIAAERSERVVDPALPRRQPQAKRRAIHRPDRPAWNERAPACAVRARDHLGEPAPTVEQGARAAAGWRAAWDSDRRAPQRAQGSPGACAVGRRGSRDLRIRRSPLQGAAARACSHRSRGRPLVAARGRAVGERSHHEVRDRTCHAGEARRLSRCPAPQRAAEGTVA